MPGPVVSDVAPGVRRLTIVSVISMHVYLIDAAAGVVAFDAAIKGAGEKILAGAGGSVAKVVLSHSHVDHRGAAPELGAPIYCHPDEIEDAEGDGGQHYIDWDLVESPVTREGLPQLHASGIAALSRSRARSTRTKTSLASGSSTSRDTLRG